MQTNKPKHPTTQLVEVMIPFCLKAHTLHKVIMLQESWPQSLRTPALPTSITPPSECRGAAPWDAALRSWSTPPARVISCPLTTSGGMASKMVVTRRSTIQPRSPDISGLPWSDGDSSHLRSAPLDPEWTYLSGSYRWLPRNYKEPTQTRVVLVVDDTSNLQCFDFGRRPSSPSRKTQVGLRAMWDEEPFVSEVV